MCAQCMAGAMTAGGAVAGTRAYLATRSWRWLTPARLRRATVALVGAGLVASALLISAPAPA